MVKLFPSGKKSPVLVLHKSEDLSGMGKVQGRGFASFFLMTNLTAVFLFFALGFVLLLINFEI